MTTLREGTFLATPQEWSVRTSKNGLLEFVCRFALDAEYDPEQNGYRDISGEGLRISGWFNLVYIKLGQHTPNDISIKQLEEALGWSDRDLRTLNDGDWSHTKVQLVLGTDEYNRRIRIQYLNHRDRKVRPRKSDAQAVANMHSAFGALLKGSDAPAAAELAKPESTASRGV